MKLTPLALSAIALLAVCTVLLTWRAKKLEASLRDRNETSALVGKAAPDFALPSLDGQRVELADYRGRKKLVVSFWASWCGPCKMEMPALVDFYKQHRQDADKFELVAISIDEERADAEDFATKQKLPFPVLFDPHSQAADAYGVEGIPFLFVIDENGKVVYGQAGYNPALEVILAHQLGLKPVPPNGGAADGVSRN